MIFKNISSDDVFFLNICKLYVDAFPEDERRCISQLKCILDNDSKFHILSVSTGDIFNGFISYWTFADFIYVEHLAISPEMRNHGLGKELIEHLLHQNHKKTAILEVEPGVDDITRRRINFYKRLGFVLRNDKVKYLQPPYSKDKSSLELWLMSYGECTDLFVSDCADIIKENVYYAYQ